MGISFPGGLETLPSLSQGNGAQLEAQLSAGSRTQDPETIEKAARGFEAWFVQYTLQEMRKTVNRSGLLGDDHTMKMFESMLDEAVGKAISEGRGLGLADVLRRSWGVEEGATPVAAHLPILPPAQVPWENAPPLAAVEAQEEDARTPLNRGPYHLTSGFGERIHPITGELQRHPGLDLAMPEGTPVQAMAAGRVIYADAMGTYGNLVIVDHGGGITTRYAHASQLDVQVGQEVAAGQVLARSGNTGRSTGPHLHFEVRKDGQAIDPLEVPWVHLPALTPAR